MITYNKAGGENDIISIYKRTKVRENIPDTLKIIVITIITIYFSLISCYI